MKTFASLLLGFALLTPVAHAYDLESIMHRCAPEVDPITLRAITHVESGAYAYAVADSGPANLPWEKRKTMVRSYFPATKVEAVAIAQELVNNGHLVDIGPLQVNVRNVFRLGSTIESAFEPCENYRLGAKILVENYLNAMAKYKNSQRALLAAISMNNTGSYVRGFSNGYVQKVLEATRVRVPALKIGGVSPTAQVRGAVQPKTMTKRDRTIEARMAKLEVESF